ncbi:MAG: hypothetical protein EKK48_12185 [Candidatus Melainabacteria bacterium]|nr:MAG: hypothetical protein EKK48_12185 [Candidatus Melainabacteria bacterium]
MAKAKKNDCGELIVDGRPVKILGIAQNLGGLELIESSHLFSGNNYAQYLPPLPSSRTVTLDLAFDGEAFRYLFSRNGAETFLEIRLPGGEEQLVLAILKEVGTTGKEMCVSFIPQKTGVLPVKQDPDWRPPESIPEDYYA